MTNIIRQEIVVLQNATCPDVAQAGTCGTFSSPDPTLTANSTLAAAPNFWKALQGFMGAFPQYSRNGFHFSTESYGGHYGPIFNGYIEEQNAKNIPGAHKISLESVIIGYVYSVFLRSATYEDPRINTDVYTVMVGMTR